VIIEMTFTFVGECPDDVQVGQEFRLGGVVTVHTIKADMVDTSTYAENGGRSYLPTVVSLGVYGNEVTLTPPADPVQVGR
jgi:hypothetical protein